MNNTFPIMPVKNTIVTEDSFVKPLKKKSNSPSKPHIVDRTDPFQTKACFLLERPTKVLQLNS